jgi:hypothetical protein
MRCGSLRESYGPGRDGPTRRAVRGHDRSPPATGDSRRYLVERELTVMAELEAIVGDYLEQAATWDVIPAAGSCPLLAQQQEAEAEAPACCAER